MLKALFKTNAHDQEKGQVQKVIEQGGGIKLQMKANLAAPLCISSSAGCCV